MLIRLLKKLTHSKGRRFSLLRRYESSKSPSNKLYSPSLIHKRVANDLKPSFSFVGSNPYVWQQEGREKLKELLAWDTLSAQKPDKIDERLIWEAEDELGLYKKISLPCEYEYRMPAYVGIPHSGFSGKWLICLQGHTTGMHNSMGVCYENESLSWIPHGDRDFSIWCMENGYGSLCIEHRSLGERSEHDQKSTSIHSCHDAAMKALVLGRTLLGERLFDLGTAIRYLEKRYDKYATIGVVGHSLGGTLAIYAAALYEEISFCIASGCFSSFDLSILSRHHCADLYVPGVRKYFEFGDIAGLAAPKPLLFVQSVNDRLFPLAGLRSEYDKAKTIYKKFGASECICLEVGQNGHRFYKYLATSGKCRLGL